MDLDKALMIASKDKCFWFSELHEAVDVLAAEVKRLQIWNMRWRDFSKKLREETQVLANEVTRFHGIEHQLRDEIQRLKKENEQLRKGWCAESEKRMKEWSNEGEKLTELHKVIDELRKSIDSHKDEITILQAACEYWKTKYEIYVEDATGNDEIS